MEKEHLTENTERALLINLNLTLAYRVSRIYYFVNLEN